MPYQLLLRRSKEIVNMISTTISVPSGVALASLFWFCAWINRPYELPMRRSKEIANVMSTTISVPSGITLASPLWSCARKNSTVRQIC